MILADKIIDLRKKNGWSQTELAGQLGISRQSVSKWESAASIPDLDKIIKLSGLFGVSTDYLLKDSLGPESVEPDFSAEFSDGGFERPIRSVPLEEANAYLELAQKTAGKIAAGVALCILSPVVLIYLGGLSDEEGGYVIPEGLAMGIGLTLLLLMVALAVSLFIFYGKSLETYAYLKEEPLELAYGVTGVVEKQKSRYEERHRMMLIAGVALCIVSVIPLLIAAAMDDTGMGGILGMDICLVLVALGVFILVNTGVNYEAFQCLLEEGDYTRQKKEEKKKNGALTSIYWCTVTAVYLGWSLYTMNWHRTWILWPCAGVMFAAVCGLAGMVRRK